jgi:hypothetical protein
MNNEFVAKTAAAFADRLARAGGDDGERGDDGRIRQAYRLAFGRLPTGQEIQMGKDFLRASGGSWPQYTQVLLGSAEFMSVP